jgi:hypothetical protein
MKIVHVKTHEAVKFGNSQEFNFYNFATIPGRKTVDIVLNKELNCIELKTELDHVLIPMVNIAFMKLDNKAHQDKQEAKKKPKPSSKPSDIKRPR